MVLTRKCWAAKRTVRHILYNADEMDLEEVTRMLSLETGHFLPVKRSAMDFIRPFTVEIPVRPVRFVSHMPMVRRGL